MSPAVGKGAISVAFVRLSVRVLCTQRIIQESEGLACQNLEWRFPILDATCTPVLRSTGQRSGLQTGGGIPCRPNQVVALLVFVSNYVWKWVFLNMSWMLLVILLRSSCNCFCILCDKGGVRKRRSCITWSPVSSCR